VIELSAIPDRSAHVERPNIGERFIEYEEVMVGEAGQLQGLRAGSGVRDDVPMLLKDALQRPAHPIVAAGN
jgi:hypothetical protein